MILIAIVIVAVIVIIIIIIIIIITGADPGFFLGGVHSSLALLQHQ